MPVLSVVKSGNVYALPFESTPLCSQVLMEAGMEVTHPCGGHGICKKCALKMSGMLSPRTEEERELPPGMRLSCRTRLMGDAVVYLSASGMTHIQQEGKMPHFDMDLQAGKYGAAVDIGTTTVAVRLINLENGSVLGAASRENPQRIVAADVIGRMEAAMAGKRELLRVLILDAVDEMIESLCSVHGVKECGMRIVTGNTTMLYLYTGRDVEPLSHAPFEADCLFGYQEGQNFYPRCMSAFVGADITCAVLASGMLEKNQTALLIDVGTNGEIALWKDGQLLVSATAAGPAFEGGGITMGCGSVPGAVDKVSVENGKLCYHTIDDKEAVGLCGSGIIDLAAAMLELGVIDETGAMDDDAFSVAENVYLTDQDIRNIQLAKGAIAAGIKTLMDEHGIAAGDIDALYLAGGFGAHLNLKSAARIGLIPEELVDKTVVLGNAALSGAHMLLLNRAFRGRAEQLAASARTVNLGGNSAFTENFMECMLFE